MKKQLVFTVVDHYPTKPYEAWYDDSLGGWRVCAQDGCTWLLMGGDERDAEYASQEKSMDDGTLIRALAVALHSDAAKAAITGEVAYSDGEES